MVYMVGLMKLWRLTRKKHLALDGKGALQYGGRYSAPGLPIVSFASEAGLAVLVALRYWKAEDEPNDVDYVLGWTTSDASPVRVPDDLNETAKKAFVDEWANAGGSLLIAIRSAVLPEADVILMNTLHREAKAIAPLTVRSFNFEECLHRPPMLERFRSNIA
jgi:RES domain-containing protein